MKRVHIIYLNELAVYCDCKVQNLESNIIYMIQGFEENLYATDALLNIVAFIDYWKSKLDPLNMLIWFCYMR